MIEQLQLILKALPWTGPAVLGGFVLALLTTLLFPSRRSRTDRFGFALLVWCLVVAGVVTLSPVRNSYFGVPTTGCDWSIWKPLAREYWFSSGSRPPNVWLFAPAGVGVMLLDRVWRKIVGIMVLFALPPGIETLQDLYPELKRSCSSQDVVDNWTGLVMGLAVGLVLAVLVAIVRAIRGAARRRRERRDGVLSPSASTDAGARDTATPDDQTGSDRLPLGGRADRGYDEFSDFDDMPNSSRWYEEGAPTRDVSLDERGAAHPGARGSEPLDSQDGGGATRAMPRRPIADDGVDHTPAYGTPRAGGIGDDDTEIIRRS